MTGARLSGRAHRPDDDAVPPMQDNEDDRSEVLAAADAPCGRFAFSKRSQRKTGARLSGRTLRPNDDAVPPMEDIEDDRSGVLAAAGGG